jgi:hypothetical protein
MNLKNYLVQIIQLIKQKALLHLLILIVNLYFYNNMVEIIRLNKIN